MQQGDLSRHGTSLRMKSLLFTVLLKPGTLKAYQAFAAETTGPRKQEFAAMLKRYGLKTSKVWHQHIAGQDYLMIYHDAEDDALERLKSWASSTHPFDRWFDEHLKKCYENWPEEAHSVFDFKPPN